LALSATLMAAASAATSRRARVTKKGRDIGFCNNERPHQALGYRTPSEVFGQAKACGHVDNATSFGRERSGRFWPWCSGPRESNSSLSDGVFINRVPMYWSCGL
jgi:hypothetical protein